MQHNRVASRDEWLAARKALLDETTTMDFVRRDDEYEDAPRAQ